MPEKSGALPDLADRIDHLPDHHEPIMVGGRDVLSKGFENQLRGVLIQMAGISDA